MTIDAVAVDLTEIVITTGAILRYKPGSSASCFPRDLEISVDYDAGYVTPTQAAIMPTPPTGPALPSDLDRAAVLAAMAFYDQQQREQFDIAAIEKSDVDAGSINTRFFNSAKTDVLPAAVLALIEPYYRPI